MCEIEEYENRAIRKIDRKKTKMIRKTKENHPTLAKKGHWFSSFTSIISDNYWMNTLQLREELRVIQGLTVKLPRSRSSLSQPSEMNEGSHKNSFL